VEAIHRELYIKDQFSEPYYPNQNPVELNMIRYLKQTSHVLMDKTGAPPRTWYYAICYLAEIHNRTADPKLPNSITPYQMRHGVTPDISAYLQFIFWERVLYLDTEETWPNCKERPGHWLGVAHNVGDNLTFYIYDDQAKQVLARSVVCPYNDNKRVVWDPVYNTDDDSINPRNVSQKDERIFLFNVDEPVYVPTSKGYEYKGKSLLRYGNEEFPLEENIPKMSMVKKLPTSQIKYQGKKVNPKESPRTFVLNEEKLLIPEGSTNKHLPKLNAPKKTVKVNRNRNKESTIPIRKSH